MIKYLIITKMTTYLVYIFTLVIIRKNMYFFKILSFLRVGAKWSEETYSPLEMGIGSQL